MRNVFRLATVALALGAPLAVAQSPGQSEHRAVDAQLVRSWRDASMKVDKAWEALEKKDLAKAKKVAGEAAAIAPEMPDAHILLAKVAYLEKDWPKALEEVVAAESGFEKTGALRERMQDDRIASLRKRVRERDDSIAALRAQMSRTPASGQQAIQMQISRVETEKADLERIIQEPAGVVARVPAEYYFIHGNALLRLKRLDEAVAQYGLALERRPAYAEAANNLASIYYSARQYATAKAAVEKAEAAGAVLNPELKKAIEEGLAQPK
jgi:Tfp pilus assembly protein PilF